MPDAIPTHRDKLRRAETVTPRLGTIGARYGRPRAARRAGRPDLPAARQAEPPPWFVAQADVIAAKTVEKLKPLIRAEVRAALGVEARKQTRGAAE